MTIAALALSKNSLGCRIGVSASNMGEYFAMIAFVFLNSSTWDELRSDASSMPTAGSPHCSLIKALSSSEFTGFTFY
jgi:hypothetical protein